MIDAGAYAISATGCACRVARNYTVTPGYYKLNETAEEIPCREGHICPGNMVEPAFCCPGYVCSKDATSMSPCGNGYWCPPQSVEKIECGALTVCRERTTKQNKWGFFLFIVLLAVAIWLLWYLYNMGNHKKEDIYIAMINDVHHEHKEIDLQASTEMKVMANEKSSEDGKETVRDAGSAGVAADQKSQQKILENKETKFDIRFESLEYTLPDGHTIMKDVSGEFKKGHTCAVMGPSGAGKTTLFNLITGKAKRTGGKVYLNKKHDELSNYKRLVGFVPQEDVMIRELLSVTDILSFSAHRRLPKSFSSKEIDRIVAENIDNLGLSHVATNAVGDERQRGISGGQRKRVNVGMELVASPSVLFLDEPTTGLDASTAYDLCSTLRKISRAKQMTTIAIIHSPSKDAFEQFDDLCLLGKGGRMIYMGPREGCGKYFDLLGFQIGDQNPADFYLQVAMGRVKSEKLINFHWSGLYDLWLSHEKAIEQYEEVKSPEYVEAMEQAIKKMNEETLQRQATMKSLGGKRPSKEGEGCCANTGSLCKRFWIVLCVDSYRYFESLFVELFLWLKSMVCACNPNAQPVRSLPNFFVIFWLCLCRAMKQTYGSFEKVAGDMALPIGVGLLNSCTAIGAVFVGPIEDEVCRTLIPAQQLGACVGPVSDPYQNISQFLLVCINFAGITMGSETFGSERTVWFRHASTGLDGIPYVLAKWIADLPRAFFAALLTFVLFIIQFYSVGNEGNLFALILVAYFLSFAQGYFIVQFIPHNVVPLFGVVWAIFWLMLFGNNTITLNDRSSLDPFLQWVYQMSLFRWGNEAFYINELKFYNSYLDLDGVLADKGYDIDNFSTDIGAILLITLFYIGLTIVFIKIFGRSKMK
eukprot:CAMPEP_0170168654 /NCGR_PEP_ID=MMETSP0040_2-20121228/1607_1 /TAXON_ID=641309 /ORGANISM="Lotharella oceanica, Strain CCMP622" /LENGTH=870 /DNA_ID=CAMNT_0010406947 /DNA_START=54 /DNA_END=2666 /DNA_ORIENTATION=-